MLICRVFRRPLGASQAVTSRSERHLSALSECCPGSLSLGNKPPSRRSTTTAAPPAPPRRTAGSRIPPTGRRVPYATNSCRVSLQNTSSRPCSLPPNSSASPRHPGWCHQGLERENQHLSPGEALLWKRHACPGDSRTSLPPQPCFRPLINRGKKVGPLSGQNPSRPPARYRNDHLAGAFAGGSPPSLFVSLCRSRGADWSQLSDLNRRPSDYKSGALPLS